LEQTFSADYGFGPLAYHAILVLSEMTVDDKKVVSFSHRVYNDGLFSSDEIKQWQDWWLANRDHWIKKAESEK